jgi:hypothetical protein
MTLVATGDFGPFGGRAWLNCAHQGPLPRVAVQAACHGVEPFFRASERRRFGLSYSDSGCPCGELA